VAVAGLVVWLLLMGLAGECDWQDEARVHNVPVVVAR